MCREFVAAVVVRRAAGGATVDNYGTYPQDIINSAKSDRLQFRLKRDIVRIFQLSLMCDGALARVTPGRCAGAQD
jgi:hypothetical protein